MFADEFRSSQVPVGDARPFRLLLVSANGRVQRSLGVLWREHEVLACTDPGAAVELAAARDVDAVLCDQRVPPALGIDLLIELREKHPRALRMLLTDRPDVRLLLEAVNDAEVFRVVDQPWDAAMVREAAQAAARAARQAPLFGGSALPPDEAEHIRRQNAVVVIDNDNISQQRLRDLLQAHYKMHFASSLDRALQFMEQHETGAIVCSTATGRGELVAALKVLKQAHPHIATVVLDTMRDTDRVVELINEAQVFRLLRQPFNPALCKPFVDAALARHWYIKQQPQSAWRVLPPESAPARSAVQLPAPLLNRIRGLPGRLHEAETVR
jgi:DNA-binding NtrC family response regulator